MREPTVAATRPMAHREVEAAAREHARRILAGDGGVREDLAPAADLQPPDLLRRLLESAFERADLVAHARIGAHHIIKTRYAGSTTMVVQARWARDAGGIWRVRDAEVVRTEPG